jgi:hypothetical protein
MSPPDKAQGRDRVTTGRNKLFPFASSVKVNNGSMDFMTKLIDEMKNKPVVQIELIGE